MLPVYHLDLLFRIEEMDTVFTVNDIKWVGILYLGSEAVLDQIIAWSMACALFLRRMQFQR